MREASDAGESGDRERIRGGWLGAGGVTGGWVREGRRSRARGARDEGRAGRLGGMKDETDHEETQERQTTERYFFFK